MFVRRSRVGFAPIFGSVVNVKDLRALILFPSCGNETMLSAATFCPRGPSREHRAVRMLTTRREALTWLLAEVEQRITSRCSRTPPWRRDGISPEKSTSSHFRCVSQLLRSKLGLLAYPLDNAARTGGR